VAEETPGAPLYVMSAHEDPSPAGALTAQKDLFGTKDSNKLIGELRAEIASEKKTNTKLQHELASEKETNAKLQHELATAKNKDMAEKAANLAPLPLLIALVLLMPKLMLLKMGLLLPRKLAGLGVDGDVASEDTALSHHQTAPEDEQSQDSKSGPLPHSGRWWAGQKLDDVFNVEGSTLGQGQYGRKFV